MPQDPPCHCVAVIGGAVAGAEVAGSLAEVGADAVVFEQNPRPYGKIEDGLPRWHRALRRKEYETIRSQLSHPKVHFVPLTAVGRDLDFRDLVDAWGFSGVVLACGAWRDRPLPVEGAEAYVGKGLIYQNPFIVWFNHANEAAYQGPRFEPQDATLLVGGGLSSIDVAKVLMIETTRARLAQRGIEVGMLELELKGIPKTLAAHHLRFEDLGLEGCTLFYRRRIQDMPLLDMPEKASPERAEKVRSARRRLVQKATEKYCFRMEPLCMPDGLIVEAGRLVGLRFRRTIADERRVTPTDETFERRGSCVISSIGSVPAPIKGVPMKGELFDFVDWDLGRLAEYPTVFSAGNVTTGKGNIVVSRKHAKAVAETMIEAFLGLGETGHQGEEALAEAAHARASEAAQRLAAQIQQQPSIAPETLRAILERVRERQQAVGYDGDFPAWMARVTPPDLE